MAPNQELKVLGRTLAEIQDHLLASRERPQASARLTALYEARARKSLAAGRLAIWLPAALLSVAVVCFGGLYLHNRPIDFVVGPGRAPGQLGVWVAANDQQATALSFSDGSRVLLRGGAQARVVSSGPHGARVVIERGSLRSDVVPRAKNEWFVVGGPFEIRVTGTSFDAAWEPEREVLQVTMYEGHVAIRADCLDAARLLKAGQSAAISCPARSAPAPEPSARAAAGAASSGASSAQGAAESEAAAAELASAAARAVSNEVPRAASSERASTASPEPFLAWRELFRQGNFKEALLAAERAGFDEACQTMVARDLLDLGASARLSGNLTRAVQAYRAVRQRFGGSDPAATAAFHLGQIAFDGRADYVEARRWFDSYLSERPNGALAAEALGRKMEAEQRAPDFASARATASVYLARYPNGAHARLAQGILNR